jgi:hypothetical protein
MHPSKKKPKQQVKLEQDQGEENPDPCFCIYHVNHKMGEHLELPPYVYAPAGAFLDRGVTKSPDGMQLSDPVAHPEKSTHPHSLTDPEFFCVDDVQKNRCAETTPLERDSGYGTSQRGASSRSATFQ